MNASRLQNMDYLSAKGRQPLFYSYSDPFAWPLCHSLLVVKAIVVSSRLHHCPETRYFFFKKNKFYGCAIKTGCISGTVFQRKQEQGGAVVIISEQVFFSRLCVFFYTSCRNQRINVFCFCEINVTKSSGRRHNISSIRFRLKPGYSCNVGINFPVV